MKHLMIIGAGGHGRVVRDIAVKVGYSQVDFLDDADVSSVPTAGKVADFKRFLDTCDFFVAIGNNKVRERLTDELRQSGASIATLVHPSAVVDSSAKIGVGTVVMAGVVINADAAIGNGVILNTCSSVDHDCVVQAYCHVAVGAHLCGTVTLGQRTFVGAGATVINNISICEDCMIGAGAVVVRNAEQSGTFLGVPARLTPKRESGLAKSLERKT